MDLIYCGEKELYNEFRQAVVERYPEAKIEDASDSIHPYRLSVETGGEMVDWFKFVIQSGFGACSLHIQTALHGADILPDLHAILKQAVDELKAAAPDESEAIEAVVQRHERNVETSKRGSNRLLHRPSVPSAAKMLCAGGESD